MRLTTYEPVEGGIPYVTVKDEQDALQKLAAYEDAEEQERLVILPCKVGDTVYTISHFCGNFMEDCNNLIPCSFCDFYESVVRRRQLTSISQIVSIMDKFGKTVFFTREEAETALKGGIK